MHRHILAAALVAAGLAATALPAAAAEDLENGADVFKKCRACHDIGPNAKNKVGPVLNGIVGRKAGTVEGFSYSDNLKELAGKGLTWDEATLDKYIANPKSVVPGGKMVFAGVKDEADRKDLIAYLKKEAHK